MKHKLGALIGMAVDQTALPTLTEAIPTTITPPVVHDYRMDGNDKLGDCVIEGTEIRGANALAGYRAPYSGPVIRLRFESGNELTVTPNHAILTPRGFVRARFLREGDNVLGAVEGREVPSLNLDVDQSPTRIEEIVSTLRGGREVASVHADTREMMPAIDFHGDESFVQGNVDVVFADSLLQRKVTRPQLGEIDGQNQVKLAHQLKGGLHGLRLALQGYKSRGSASLGGVGSLDQSDTFLSRASSIAHIGGLAQGSDRVTSLDQGLPESRRVDSSFTGEGRVALSSGVSLKERGEIGLSEQAASTHGLTRTSQLVASRTHPSDEGGATDLQLASYLLSAHASSVKLDRIVSVNLDTYSGHVYDLSTDTRWYSANSIITHNCTIAGADHCTAAWNVIYKLDLPRLSESQLEQTYFRLGHNQDLGLPEQTVVSAWKRESAPTWFGYQLTGGTQVANSSIKQVIATRGVAYLGVALPSVAEDQFDNGQPWSVVPGATIAGGHCIVGVGYDPQYLTVVTWGKTQKVTWDWWATYGFECWSLTVPQIHKVN